MGEPSFGSQSARVLGGGGVRVRITGKGPPLLERSSSPGGRLLFLPSVLFEQPQLGRELVAVSAQCAALPEGWVASRSASGRDQSVQTHAAAAARAGAP